MIEHDLFGGLLPENRKYLTQDGRTIDVKPRGKHYVEPRGGADRPGTGPQGETCGSCKHLYRKTMAKTYLKCNLMRAKWTGGGKTDIRAGWAACSKWEKPDD